MKTFQAQELVKMKIIFFQHKATGFIFQVVEAYLYPAVDESNEKFTWGRPEVESIREYAKKTFGWTQKRTDDIIMPVMKKLNEKVSQKSIRNYFKITSVDCRQDLKVSDRVKKALKKMSSAENVESMMDVDEIERIVNDDDEDNQVMTAKTRKKPRRKVVSGQLETEASSEDHKTNRKLKFEK